MAVFLEVTDNGDGTGVTVYATGDPDAYNVYRRVVTVDTLGAWVACTPPMFELDDGFIIAGTGYYQWKVQQIAIPNTESNIVFQTATDEGDSTHERCLTMLKDRIDGLALTGPASGAVTVYVRQMAEPSNITYPAIVLAIAGNAEEVRGGSIMKDDIGYPVEIIIAESCQAEADARRATHLMWRDKIRKSINNKRWDLRVPEVWNIEMRFGPIIKIPETAQQGDYRVGGMTAICVARQLRAAA